jgi:hypothetical protein
MAWAEPALDSELDDAADAPTLSSPVCAPVSANVETGGPNGVKTGGTDAVLSWC